MTPAGRISSCAVILETSWAFYGSAGTEAIRQRCHPQIHSVLSPPWTPCKAAVKSILKIPRSPVLYCKTLPGPLPGAPRIPGGLQRDLIELLGLILALKPRLNSTVLEALGRRRASSVNPGSLLPVCFLQIALESGALPLPVPSSLKSQREHSAGPPRPSWKSPPASSGPPESPPSLASWGHGAAEPCHPAPSPGALPTCPRSPDASAHCLPSCGYCAIPALLAALSRWLHN